MVDMSKAIDTVWDVSEQFTINPNHVILDVNNVKDEVIEKIKKEVKGYKAFAEKPSTDKEVYMVDAVTYELMSSAVNYQYWYGTSEVRPSGSCASKMYKLLDESFTESYKIAKPAQTLSVDVSFVTDYFIKSLSRERFPAMEKRVRHLREAEADCLRTDSFANKCTELMVDDMEDLWLLDLLVERFPGFADDIFLKRTFLFFMMLHRRMGFFKIGRAHV